MRILLFTSQTYDPHNSLVLHSIIHSENDKIRVSMSSISKSNKNFFKIHCTNTTSIFTPHFGLLFSQSQPPFFLKFTSQPSKFNLQSPNTSPYLPKSSILPDFQSSPYSHPLFLSPKKPYFFTPFFPTLITSVFHNRFLSIKSLKYSS